FLCLFFLLLLCVWVVGLVCCCCVFVVLWGVCFVVVFVLVCGVYAVVVLCVVVFLVCLYLVGGVDIVFRVLCFVWCGLVSVLVFVAVWGRVFELLAWFGSVCGLGLSISGGFVADF
ncbi:hypothetical protein RA279_28015, partial [Pseudomonas syringae pv. tagetis]|uniref:hypothetical protein n=1 Tax=Pseudomonas syringae group genomosp. 7 TaxID=251699 RepID=UPI00376FE493